MEDSCPEDELLDLAIARQDEGRFAEAFALHKRRMMAEPRLHKTDAVRLLGWNNSTRQQVPELEGIFAATRVGQSFRPLLHDVESNNKSMGQSARQVFDHYGYCLDAGRQILLTLLGSVEDDHQQQRIFSGNSFFNHRHDLPALELHVLHDNNTDHPKPTMGLNVLLYLFLFGLAVERDLVIQAIGQDECNALFRAGLLQPSLALQGDVVASVQVYPLSTSDLFPSDGTTNNSSSSEKSNNTLLLLPTDWPLESFHPKRNAIMPIGYDTLELCALSAGDDNIRTEGPNNILDLCCGCGVQGLLWITCHPNSWSQLVLVDINPRACHYVMASLALNGLLRMENNNKIHVLQGNLYDPIRVHLSEDMTFQRILTNPPFVADFCNTTTDGGALYAGSGICGLDAVHDIVNRCFQYLAADDNGQLLMVTELPNVQQSCQLLESFLAPPKEDSRNNKEHSISIAYVVADVETVQEYAQERAEERGTSTNHHQRNQWEADMQQHGIHNRALVLAAIGQSSSMGQGSILRLFPYEDQTWSGSDAVLEDPADEDDAFLTLAGVMFARNALLSGNGA
ncbi:Methyltransferase [Seminavis robusta]|uniref:Methyltransferase n=1 Tax=Seminavis robusta TaxID=568900 RepID=A0A9N8HSG9_9STRA|nr:Methyltransferase [Seminavis robusta]|eukprot:Sro1167_g248320.1 Methyltransferase (568) ;mRNA; f:4221-5924